jgi:3-dehydroquinate synthase
MGHSDHIIFLNRDNLSGFITKYIGETEKNLVLADTNTAKLCFPVLKEVHPIFQELDLIVVDAGDDEKNITSLHYIWSALLHHGADRNTQLINLGGGMITDLGGFAASTFKRGIPFIHIPTSLLGMVDAAIGGKNAINISKVKNQAGTFSRPEAVMVYPGFLNTLPAEETLSGYAEVLKTAIAFDRDLYYDLVETSPDELPMDHIIQKTASIKNEITTRDFHDEGERQGLNFGHTVGHGLEALYLTKGHELKHGFAVAAGMICEAYISTKVLKLPEQSLQQITDYIRRSFPPALFREKDITDILALINHDKKKSGGKLRMSLLNGIGNCKFGVAVQEEIIVDSLKYYLS